MRVRNYRLLIQGSPTEFHNKQTLHFESNWAERALLLQTAPSQIKTGVNWPIHMRPYGKAKTP